MTQLAEFCDTHPLVVTTYQDARTSFEKWAGIDGCELPEDPIDATQVMLKRWERDRFGLQADERLALGVVEELTEGDLAADSGSANAGEEAVDALGDVCVYAGQLLMNNRLAIGPVIALANLIREDVLHQNGKAHDPIHEIKTLAIAHGALSQTVLKSAQKVRGLDDAKRYHVRLIGCLAMCIARASLVVDETATDIAVPVSIHDTYITIGSEVAQRGEGHSAIPKLTVH